ncbi:MAG TPA: DsbA family oxidoreductase [Dongiaceae bacterium]|nr:DsbA family oxidoreductase [Dongiaceae bacterium]
MAKRMQIDFVSDVVCPWCAIGLRGLETALQKLDGEVEAEIHFQPFELNPQMPAEGENRDEHIARKYGQSPEQTAAVRERIRERAASVGFTMSGAQDHIYNTFDAHRLLHWAGLEGRQPALKHALLKAYFTDALDISDREVLVAKAAAAGLDPEAARDVLESGRYAEDVRQDEQSWLNAGINSVPAVIVNRKYLISGGQPPEVFEESLRQIAAQAD